MPPAVIATAPPAAAKPDLKNDRRSRSSVSLNFWWCSSNSGQFLSSPAHMLSLPAFCGSRKKARTVPIGAESLFLLRLFRHPLEAVLHVLHLTAQVIDVAVLRHRLRQLLRLGCGVVAAARRH